MKNEKIERRGLCHVYKMNDSSELGCQFGMDFFA